jgi:hypothetical protein
VVVELCVVEVLFMWKTRFVTAKKIGAKLRAELYPGIYTKADGVKVDS